MASESQLILSQPRLPIPPPRHLLHLHSILYINFTILSTVRCIDTLDGYEDIYQLIEKGDNVTRTAKILGISRNTVMKAMDGKLKDLLQDTYSFWLTSFEPLSLL